MEVVLNDASNANDRTLKMGDDGIDQRPSEVHMGIDRNAKGHVDIAARVQTERRTMYAMMGTGAFGSSGVAPPLVTHLLKIYALPRMIYGLEVFSLSTDDIMQLEQLQRKVIRQIQSFLINTTLTAVYGLLGIRPIEQELDIRKLVLLRNVFLNKDSLEYEIDSWRSNHMKAKAGSQSVTVHFTSSSFQAFIMCARTSKA